MHTVYAVKGVRLYHLLEGGQETLEFLWILHHGCDAITPSTITADRQDGL